ncbi:MAG: cyclic pyranopterin monophosphate synthase MoaC [Bacillota bacterium]|jgi:cyclic pyranopterin phosphate synthase
MSDYSRLQNAQTAGLTHLKPEGGVHMVDVGSKEPTLREAVARCSVKMQPETLKLISEGKMPKGDVLATAQVAGIMAAKKTWELIPLCHILNLSGVEINLTPNTGASSVDIEATVRVTGKTGAEMESLTAVSVAGLAIYDMCKAVDKTMEITDIRLVKKSGGKSGTFVRDGEIL